MIALLLALLAADALAEGTAELGTTQRVHPSTQLRVDILAGGESITWRGNYPITVYAPGARPNVDPPLGTWPSGSTIPASAGIGTYTVVLTGPQIPGQTPGFETNWDLAVPGARGGRVWSRAWQLDATDFSQANAFNGSFYAKVDGGAPGESAVVEFRARGLAGFIWFVAANDFGIAGQDGRSYNWPDPTNTGGPAVTIQHAIYLNPPENATYTSVAPSVAGAGFDSDGPTCEGVATDVVGGAFTFETDTVSTWHITCDTNDDGVLDFTTDGDVHLLVDDLGDPRLVSSPADDVRRVAWDGTDNQGQPLPPGTYECQVLVTVGEFHYIASDVETAYPGIRLFEVSLGGGRAGLPMFWNDGEVAYRNVAAPGFERGLDFSGPYGILSGNPGAEAIPNVNARTWGAFVADSKGDRAFLDTWTFVGSAASGVFQVTVYDPIADGDLDGLLDAAESCLHGTDPTLPDTDADGLPDELEVNVLPTDPLVADSDGDGLLDGEELGSVADPRDTDRDGTPDVLDEDDDGDGIPTAQELPQGDTDEDEIPDHLDGDDDGDGVLTRVERLEGNTDEDGLPDYLDPDDDGDGVDTIDEDYDGDGDPRTDDTDEDNLPDYLDPDDDGDGIPTRDEDRDGDGDPRNDDTDLDELPDYLDPDDDGDGIDTIVEGTADPDGDLVPAWLDDDSDGDGVPDAEEAVGDTDGDSIPDRLDDDDDGDGLPTAEERLRGDSDEDGIPDTLDDDDDDDGIPTRVEGDADPDEDELPSHLDDDSDGDGLPDAYEGAVDTDDDDIPDFLDLDSDGDGRGDAEEGTVDTDGDLLPDHLDPDDDGDGVPSGSERDRDTDEDGVIDALDTDDDGDGIDTAVELAWPDTDVDGDEIPNWIDEDSDGDGLPDAIEGTVDTDQDGVPDYLDPDGAYTLHFQGGCTLDHGRGGAGLAPWLLLLVPALRRRR